MIECAVCESMHPAGECECEWHDFFMQHDEEYREPTGTLQRHYDFGKRVHIYERPQYGRLELSDRFLLDARRPANAMRQDPLGLGAILGDLFGGL